MQLSSVVMQLLQLLTEHNENNWDREKYLLQNVDKFGISDLLELVMGYRTASIK